MTKVRGVSGGRAAVLALAVFCLSGDPRAQAGMQIGQIPGNGPPPPSWSPGAVKTAGNLELLPVQGQVFLLAGAGGNMVVQVGDDGLLVVDTGTTDAAPGALALLREQFNRPIRFVIDTNADPDHMGGNAIIGGAGHAQNVGVGGRAGILGGPPAGAQIYAHEKVLNRMSAPTGQSAALPFEFWPTDTFFTEEKQIFFNGEAVRLLYQPDAHTDGDVAVFFRRSDVVATGDVFSTKSFPVFDPDRGGSIQGVLDALNRLLDVTIPDFNQEAGTYVVPGHGHISDEADLAEYRDMSTIIRDRIQDLVSKGQTLEQVQAARPTFDYDGRYRATAGEWTSERFVEAVYRDLAGTAR